MKRMKSCRKTTERKKYRDLEQRYKLLIDLMDHIPDVIYFKDTKGRLIMVNQAHARGLALKPEDVIGKTDFDLFSKERAEMMAKDDLYILTTGKPIIDKIERATRPDGADNYVSTTKIPRFNKRGKIVGLVGITRDITHRMQLEYIKAEKDRTEKKLELCRGINRMKSEFVAILSHELRTPLAIAKEAVIQVADQLAGPVNPKQRKLLTITRNNLERLRQLIDNLLDMSRIEKHRVKLHYSLVNLNDLIMGSSQYFKKMAKDKNMRLRYVMPREPINIFIDAERINQVIANLINNALKFTEENGEITVEAKMLETKMRVGIIDTGIGIEKRYLHRLFTRFTQVSSIADMAEKGLGLGLSIAKELIELHEGEIWAESTLGVGSRFYFTLPRIYAIKMLDKRKREKINHILNRSRNVYLINVSIINFKEFKKELRVRATKLLKDLKVIIAGVLNGFSWPDTKKHPVILQDSKYGTYTIIFSEVTEKEAARISVLLKEEITNYFERHKTANLFINLGILAYPATEKPAGALQLPVNIYVKKIYIGSEIRRFKRINYNADMEIFLPEHKTELSQTIDISTGGICFISKTPLETDARINIGLKLQKNSKPLYLKGRVAWRKNITESQKECFDKYKIGVEFLGLKDKKKKILQFIRSISPLQRT